VLVDVLAFPTQTGSVRERERGDVHSAFYRTPTIHQECRTRQANRTDHPY